MTIGSRVLVVRGEKDVVERTGKGAALLAVTALEGAAERRWLAMALWPKSQERQARNNLRTRIHRLNRQVGTELLAGADRQRLDGERAAVVPESKHALLASRSRQDAEHTTLLGEAGIEPDLTPQLADWLEAARQRQMRARRADLCQGLVQALEPMPGDSAHAGRAEALARACVQLEPLCEQWHRQPMDPLSRCGDRAAALLAYEECQTRLMEQLGVQPDVQTRTVHLRVLRGQAKAPPWAGGTDISAGLTPLERAARFPVVERDELFGALDIALSQGLHVAAHGEAGVGKTRLLRQLGLRANSEQLSLRCGSGQDAYAALAQLLQAVQPRRAPRVGASERIELARRAPLAFPDVEASVGALSVTRLHAALRHGAGHLREAGVHLLVLDDVHETDPSTKAGLAFRISDPVGGPPPPSLLLAYRSGKISWELDRALLTAHPARRARRFALPRLTLAGVKTLLQAVDSARQARRPDELAAQLLQRTGGNPLFVIELAEHLLDREDRAIGNRADLDALLKARLAAHSMAGRQLASAAAVGAEDFTVEMASAVTGQPLLALMHPWTELQERGLFSDHGLAHDLVRDAVLGTLPEPIRRVRHRQVAAHLAGLGIKGSAVFRHWMAGQDFESALPHLVHQVHATSAAGLSTRQLDLALKDILENLWASAELRGYPQTDRSPPEVWPRMVALLERVRAMRRSLPLSAWEAFEQSRVRFFHERKVRDAYATLSAVVDTLPSPGVERARAELMLVLYSFALHGGPREHVRCAREALRDLPERTSERRLRSAIDAMSAVFLDPREPVARSARTMTEARRRAEQDAASEVRARIAEIHLMLGNHRRAHRHFAQLWRRRLDGVDTFDHNTSLRLRGLSALGAAYFDEALSHFEKSADGTNALEIYRALPQARLGQWVSTPATLERATHPAVFNGQAPSFHFAAVIRADLDARAGRDPLAALRVAVATLESQGIAGSKLQLMAWEVHRRTGSADERIAEGNALVHLLESQGQSRRWLPALIDVAEAHAEAGERAARALALKATHELRRGYTAVPAYVPDCLMRCARLLGDTDPAEAASLQYVATRWVMQALDHVPAPARESFIEEIEVNRLLLQPGTPANAPRAWRLM